MYQFLVVLFHTFVLALEIRVEWKASKGKLRLSIRIKRSPASNLLFRFKSLKFLLTNSKIPRDTKKLVEGVAEKKTNVSQWLLNTF